MSDGFPNPVVGGGGDLVRERIRSPNYIPGTTGWTLNQDGTVEFNTLGGTLQVNNLGVFFYVPSAGLGNLRMSVTTADGMDPYGNSFHQGLFINQQPLWETGPHSDTVVINPVGSLFPSLSFLPTGFLEIARIYADGPNDKLVIDASSLLDLLSSIKVTGKGEFTQDLKARSLGGAMNVQTQANTTAERQIGIIAGCIPANDAVYESSYHLGFAGRFTFTGGGTVRIRAYVGSRTAAHRIYDSGAVTPSGGAGQFVIDTDFHITAAGSSGTFMSGGFMHSDAAGIAAPIASVFGAASGTPAAIDTTVANDVEVTVQYGTASPGNSCAGISGFVTRNVSG